MNTKIFISILYNSGVEKNHEMNWNRQKEDVTLKDAKKAIKYLQDELINESFKSGVDGYIKFLNKKQESVSVNIQSISEVRFKIVEE